MKKIFCDKCGTELTNVSSNAYYKLNATVNDITKNNLKMHLCLDCMEDVCDYISGEDDEE